MSRLPADLPPRDIPHDLVAFAMLGGPWLVRLLFCLQLLRFISGGRKPKLDAKQIRHIKALLRDPNTCVAELARDYGVSRTTIYKHCGVVQPRHD